MDTVGACYCRFAMVQNVFNKVLVTMHTDTSEMISYAVSAFALQINTSMVRVHGTTGELLGNPLSLEQVHMTK